MQEEGRWGRARDAVSGLADSLTPDDHVTLITFHDGAETVFEGEDPDADTLLDALPAEPTGDQTDIGAAIDEGVDALNRDGASDIAAFVLLTDGELDAAEDSDFVTADAPAWDDLRTRADEATADRQVGAFALSLGPESDAGLLTQVFPNAQVATPDDIVAFLSGLTDEVTRFRVGEILAPELEQPVTVTLTEPTVDGATATLIATWTSTTTYLPTTVSAVQLTPAVEGAALGMDPATLDLSPGQTQTSTVTITLPPGTDAAVALAATLTSPWQPQLAPLNIGQSLAATSAPVQLTVAASAPASSPSASPSAAPAPEGRISLVSWTACRPGPCRLRSRRSPSSGSWPLSSALSASACRNSTARWPSSPPRVRWSTSFSSRARPPAPTAAGSSSRRRPARTPPSGSKAARARSPSPRHSQTASSSPSRMAARCGTPRSARGCLR